MELRAYPIAFPRGPSVEQVARRCQATAEAVSLWIDLGMLETASDGDESVVPLPALAAFLEHYSLPAPSCSKRRLRTVLVVDDEPYVLEKDFTKEETEFTQTLKSFYRRRGIFFLFRSGPVRIGTIERAHFGFKPSTGLIFPRHGATDRRTVQVADRPRFCASTRSGQGFGVAEAVA